MAEILLNVTKINNIDLSDCPDRYPSKNTGRAVIEKLVDNDIFILYRADHGIPNSEELRNIDTGRVTSKDIKEIDVKNDYFSIHKQTKLLFYTQEIGIKTIEKLLCNAISPSIQIVSLFSHERIINKMEELSEIIFYAQPNNTTSLFSEQDELNKALNRMELLGGSKENVREIFLGIKYAGMTLNNIKKEKLKKFISDLNYKNVALKASWMADTFTSIINANEVTTKIKLSNIEREKGKINKISLENSLSYFFKSENFKELLREAYV